MARQATNNQILTELKAINGRIVALEQWKIAKDAADSAVEKFKNEMTKNNSRKLYENYQKSKLQILTELSPLIIALTALVYILIDRLRQ